MLRASHNALVLAQWGNNQSKDDGRAILARELHEKAVEVRVCTLFAIAKLKTWNILGIGAWPLLPPPRLSTVRRSAGVDVLLCYGNLKDVAVNLCAKANTVDCTELLERL